MSHEFVPFDEFDQDDKFPHKPSRKILNDLIRDFDGVMGVEPGIGVSVDDSNPAYPIVNAIPYTLPQATEVVLGGIRLGVGLIYNPITKQVDVSGSGGSGGDIYTDARLTGSVTAFTSVGGISTEQILPEGMLFTDFVKQLLLAPIYPTFVIPSLTLNSSLSGTVEAGTTADITLTVSFNRGLIKGVSVNGVWDSSAVQDNRAGPASSYVIEGVNTGLSEIITIVGAQISDGAKTFTASVNYSAGVQPIDSKGNAFDSPLPAGVDDTTTTVIGKRKAFWGTDLIETAPPTTSNEIRALSDSLMGPEKGTTFTINIPINTTRVVFAYPKSISGVDQVIYIQALGVNVKDIFTESEILVEGVNGYTAIPYRVYTFVPLEPFSSAATYNVTV